MPVPRDYEMPEYLCTISFKGEAFESAAAAYENLRGWAVNVYQWNRTSPWTATIGRTVADDEDGQYKVELLVWNGDEEPHPDTCEMRRLDIYDDIRRIEVF